MKGDFSRDSFDPAKHYTRVLTQQGRVQLDADWNEQANLFVHELRRLATELIGPHGGSGNGFEIVPLSAPCDFGITFGTYFVDGIRCENLPNSTSSQETSLRFTGQPEYPSPPPLRSDGRYLIYLDVWEREITYINDPSLREFALGGADTAIRTKVVWQVKTIEDRTGSLGVSETQVERFLRDALPLTTARLQVRRHIDNGNTGYPPLENHLYRVEIHSGGAVDDNASFKWSRDNGSRIFAITGVARDAVYVADLETDDDSGLRPGSYVEYEDDESVLRNEPHGVLRISAVDTGTSSVRVEDPTGSVPREGLGHHALLRAWDGPTRETKPLHNGSDTNNSEWISIENGIEIQFVGGAALSGDYWLIPARTADADIEWQKNPSLRPGDATIERRSQPFSLLAAEQWNSQTCDVFSAHKANPQSNSDSRPTRGQQIVGCVSKETIRIRGVVEWACNDLWWATLFKDSFKDSVNVASCACKRIHRRTSG